MIKDGGPAFPCVIDSYNDVPAHNEQGMTLRDYFAAHAPEVPAWFKIDGFPKMAGCSVEATRLYELELDAYAERRAIAWPWHYADAMLAARDKGEVPR